MPRRPLPDALKTSPHSSGLTRSHVVSLLAAAFLGVSAIAYSDYPREDPTTPLNEQEQAGKEVWRANNCQVCHQIHGFGGFHGPDLTNRLTDRVLDAELTTVILNGKDRMPAFDLSDEELDALCAWLRWVDRSGRAVLQPLVARAPLVPAQHFKELITQARERGGPQPSAEVLVGLEIWTLMGCGACHRPFAAGLLREPDLSAAALDRSLEALGAILDEGRGRMPATPLDEDQKRALQNFLQWVAENRSELAEFNLELTEFTPFQWGAVPWFEYR